MAFLDLLAARAAAGAADVAIRVDGGAELTFGDWERRSTAVAAGMAARRVRPGDRIALLCGRSKWDEFAVGYAGVLKAGAVAVLLAPGGSAASIARTLAHAGAVGVLADGVPRPHVGSVWVDRPADLEIDAVGEYAAGAVGSGAVVELIYRAAPLAPPQAVSRTYAETSQPGPLAGGAVVHTWAPGSSAGQLAMSAVVGGTAAVVVSAAGLGAHRLMEVIAEERADSCGLTPAIAAALVASGAAVGWDTNGVRQVVLAGAPGADLRDRLGDLFPAARVAVVDAIPVPEVSSGAPLAPSQEAMVWHELFSPGSFNLPCLVRRYRGALDVSAMAWALSELMRRHEPLRSRFEIVRGQARQRLDSPPTLALAVVDLTGSTPPERDRAVARLLAEATGRPFDLAGGPLFAPRVVRLGADDHLLVVRLHHTVFDDWSVDVFRRELSGLYAAALDGRPSSPPPASFTDFCRAERALVDGPSGDDQRAWWRRELAGAPLAVQLPIGEREAVEADRMSPLRVDVAAALVPGIRQTAARLRATPYMTLLAAFSVVVSRWTGLDDLVIASVVAHRNRTELESLIGCFTKKVPVRLRLGGDPTFAELVGRARATLLGALGHQDITFEDALAQALAAPAAAHGVVPQINVVFQAETPRRAKLVLPGLDVSAYEVPDEARSERHFSRGRDGRPPWGAEMYLETFLILSLIDAGPEMALVARGSFAGAAVERLISDLIAVVEAIVDTPELHVSELPGSGPLSAPSTADAIELRGFRAYRSLIEDALARAPGVAEAAVVVRADRGAEPQLVAYVVPSGVQVPTLASLRRALWSSLSGVLWPSAVVAVDSLQRLADGRADPSRLPPPPAGAELASSPAGSALAAMWSELSGRRRRPHDSYWQDFSFLHVLAEARNAGLMLTDEDIARLRTPEMIAVAAEAGLGSQEAVARSSVG